MKKITFNALLNHKAHNYKPMQIEVEVGGQAVLGRQEASPTPWLTERHGYDPT